MHRFSKELVDMSQILYWSLLILLTSIIPVDPSRSRQAVLHIFRDVKGSLPKPPDSIQDHGGPWAYACGDCSTHLSPAAPETATLQPPLEPRGIHTVFGKTRPKERAWTFPPSGLFMVWSKNLTLPRVWSSMSEQPCIHGPVYSSSHRMHSEVENPRQALGCTLERQPEITRVIRASVTVQLEAILKSYQSTYLGHKHFTYSIMNILKWQITKSVARVHLPWALYVSIRSSSGWTNRLLPNAIQPRTLNCKMQGYTISIFHQIMPYL